MNFEQLLAGALRHRRTKDVRRHRLDRDLQDRDNQWRVLHNQQRFSNQYQMQQRSQESQMVRQQQQQHFGEQQRQAQEERESAQIDADIEAVRERRRRNEITTEEERTLLWKLENKKRGIQTAGAPPPDTPWWVGTEQDVGKKWWVDTEDKKPDGTPWRLEYSRTNRGDVDVIRDERKEWEDRDNAKRDQNRADAKELREQKAADRAAGTAERAESREDRMASAQESGLEGTAEDRRIAAEDRSKADKKTEDDAKYTQLERRSQRDARANLRQDWIVLTSSEEWKKASRRKKEQLAAENGFDETGAPTPDNLKTKEAELLDKYLEAELPGYASTGQPGMQPAGIPFNDDTGMYEVVV